MSLSKQDIRFLAFRRKLLRIWPFIGTLGFALLAGYSAWMFRKNPLMIDPVEVASRLRDNSISKPALALMATFVPLIFLTCLILLAAIIVFTFMMLSNEKRLHRIIDDLLTKVKEHQAS